VGCASVVLAGTAVKDWTLQETPSSTILPPATSNHFDFTPARLSDYLRAKVTEVTESKPLTGGQTGLSLDKVSYVETIDGKEEKKSLVAKYLSARHVVLPGPQRIIFEVAGLGPEVLSNKEFSFYTQYQSALASVGVLSPALYFAGLDDYGCRASLFSILFNARSDTQMLLLMEDLSRMKNVQYGQPLEDEELIATVKCMARMHARFWEKPVVEEPAPLYSFFYPTKPKLYRRYFNFLTRNPEKFYAKLVNKWKGHGDEMIDSILFGDFDSKANYENVLTAWKKYQPLMLDAKKREEANLFQHRTMVHGDFHPGNIFFDYGPEGSKKEPQVYLIDWQLYGSSAPSLEFIYFLSSVKSDPDRDSLLLKAYHNELTSDFGKGVLVREEEYPYQTFQKEVEIGVVSVASMWMTFGLLDTPWRRAKMTPQEKEQEELFVPALLSTYERAGRYSEKMLREWA